MAESSFKVGILVFPGSNCDRDCQYAVTQVMGARADFIWHKESTLPQVDAVIIPGGFSYGDYLRTGAIARFSPVMAAVTRFAEAGGVVLGICNGFQILLEAGLLPGAMLRNHSLSFVCKDIHIRVENTDTPLTSRCKPGQVLTLPIAHGEGNYYADQATPTRLKARNRVVFRYCTEDGQVTLEANPNGSLDNIAGIVDDTGNVLGLMPHPERGADVLLGNEDGRLILLSLLDAIKRGRYAPKPVLAS
jgi:phosphoribosylformylglycinamidine synthase I